MYLGELTAMSACQVALSDRGRQHRVPSIHQLKAENLHAVISGLDDMLVSVVDDSVWHSDLSRSWFFRK